MLRLLLLSALLATASATGAALASPPGSGEMATEPRPLALPGREEDARVAQIAFRLATTGRDRCKTLASTTGMVLQHLTQFQPGDRAGIVAALPLDRGPGVIVIVPGSPADRAGIVPGDVLLAIDGTALPPEPGLSDPFDAERARARADAIVDLLARPQPYALTLLRDGRTLSVRVAPAPACPSIVHLARSGQRNAFSDGRHVFLTTGVLTLVKNDDELAFIVAHEMAHTILGHAAIMRGPSVKKGLGRTFGRSGEIVRGVESAADALGAELMLDAGYDPVRGATILTRVGGMDLGIALFATHEPDSVRINAIRAIAAQRARP